MPHARAAAAALFFATLAACAPGAPGDDVAAASDPAEDACGAAARQDLVATSVGELDPATLPEPRRIIFPGQTLTQDFSAERLNVEIGPDDRIARVYCG
jgi:hypothetical protein